MTEDAEAQDDEMTALGSILADDDGGDVVLERAEDSGIWQGSIGVAAEMVVYCSVASVTER